MYCIESPALSYARLNVSLTELYLYWWNWYWFTHLTLDLTGNKHVSFWVFEWPLLGTSKLCWGAHWWPLLSVGRSTSNTLTKFTHQVSTSCILCQYSVNQAGVFYEYHGCVCLLLHRMPHHSYRHIQPAVSGVRAWRYTRTCVCLQGRGD